MILLFGTLRMCSLSESYSSLFFDADCKLRHWEHLMIYNIYIYIQAWLLLQGIQFSTDHWHDPFLPSLCVCVRTHKRNGNYMHADILSLEMLLTYFERYRTAPDNPRHVWWWFLHNFGRNLLRSPCHPRVKPPDPLDLPPLFLWRVLRTQSVATHGSWEVNSMNSVKVGFSKTGSIP